MKATLGIIGIILVAVAIVVGVSALAAFVILSSVQGIIENGPNFWDIFWLTITGVVLFGSTGAASK